MFPDFIMALDFLGLPAEEEDLSEFLDSEVQDESD